MSLCSHPVGRSQRRDVTAYLSRGPWCWPLDADVEAFARARIRVPGGPPSARVGEALLVAVNTTAASLWKLVADNDEGQVELVQFGSGAFDAWADARASLTRSVPVLWESVRGLPTRPRGALPVAPPLPRHGHIGVQDRHLIDGASFGLSFLLAAASTVFDRPLPVDLAASATVSASGRIGIVGELAEKIEIVAREAPRVTRLLVASEQATEARATSQGRVEIVPVERASEALDAAFGDTLVAYLVDAGSSRARRAELIASFFRLAYAGGTGMSDWTPVERAAGVALDRWPNLDTDERYTLEFARAIAARHENNRGCLALPAESWLARRPLPVRIGIVATLVQQAADTSIPRASEVEALAARFVVEPPEAFGPHLKLLGALGRLFAVTGRCREALLLQQRVAAAFLDIFECQDASRPLAECYRLAGVLGDQAAYDAACDLHRRIDASGGVGEEGAAFVHLSRARAGLLLGIEGNEVEATLARLAHDERNRAHVRWSASRWLVRCLDETGRAADAEREVATVAAAVAACGNDVECAEEALALIDLDRGLRRGDADQARAAVERLRVLEAGVLGHLLAVAPPGGEAEYAGRFYPY